MSNSNVKSLILKHTGILIDTLGFLQRSIIVNHLHMTSKLVSDKRANPNLYLDQREIKSLISLDNKSLI